MRLALIAAAFGLLITLPAQAQDTMPFACEGAFGPDGTPGMLVAEFGANNVVHTQIHGAKDTTPMASVVYPDDPERRLAVVWQDESAKAQPGYVVIPEGSRWTISGVETGMSMPEVEAVNGKPFLLGGFNDEDNGMVFDWDGGTVKTDLADCFVLITLQPALLGAPVELDDAAETEGAHRSDDPIYKVLAPRVREILVTYRLVD